MEAGAEQQAYQYLLDNCTLIIGKVEQLAASYDQLLHADGIALSNSIKALESAPFEQARAKLRSQLINMAICGAFSSGKSFLISALIDRIKWYPDPSAKDMLAAQEVDRYTTLLPVSPQQTNSCPLAIIPWPSGKRFQVLFDDSKQWEDKCDPSASDEDVSRLIQAYATDVGEWRAARAPGDRQRNVVRARLLVGPLPYPAIIYDLPGIGGIGEAYLQAVHEALRHADCIIYVASAIKELTDAEFALLRFVEEVADQEATPIFFVLSQIDREPDWNKILVKDNQFLETCFENRGDAKKDIIGQGFVPVSAAAEAKARGMFESGKISEPERDQAVARSGMPAFRSLLQNHLTTHSGPAHLREIMTQMYEILKDVRAHIQNREQAELLPLQDAEVRIRESRTLVRALSEKSMALAGDLDRLGQSTLEMAMQGTRPEDLRELFTDLVEPIINKADVTKDKERDKIQQSIKLVRDEWLQRPGDGFVATWTRAWSAYQKQSIALLRQRVSQAAEEAAVTFPVIVGDEFAPEIEESAMDVQDRLQVVRVAQQISFGVTGLGIGGVAAGAIAFGSAAFTIAPVGLFLIGVGAAGMGWSAIKKQRDLGKLRAPMIEYLRTYADQVVMHLDAQAKRVIARQKTEILNVVTQLISVQRDNITALENRLKTGDLKAHQQQIKRLQQFENECDIVEQLITNPRLWSASNPAPGSQPAKPKPASAPRQMRTR